MHKQDRTERILPKEIIINIDATNRHAQHIIENKGISEHGIATNEHANICSKFPTTPTLPPERNTIFNKDEQSVCTTHTAETVIRGNIAIKRGSAATDRTGKIIRRVNPMKRSTNKSNIPSNKSNNPTQKSMPTHARAWNAIM